MKMDEKPNQSRSGPGSPRTPLHRAGLERTSPEIWQERCMELQLELHRTRSQATRVRDMLRDKLSELEQRVLEAEGRAEEAEDKVRVMEQRLSTWNDLESNTSHQQLVSNGRQQSAGVLESSAIESLETQVNEQKQLRLQDARQVEAKAARIKEWVTNKLRELEHQNQLLRDQNARCCHQLTLLKNHIATQGSRYSTVPTRSSISRLEASSSGIHSTGSSPATARRRLSETPDTVLAGGHTYAPTMHNTQIAGHRRNCSAGADMSHSLAQDLAEAVDGLALHNRPLLPTTSSSHSDFLHDYAEIYTPSREDKLPVWLAGNNKELDDIGGSKRASCDTSGIDSCGPKPPTPPLHRFPSWEAKIYQLASDGLKQWDGEPAEGENHGVNLSSGYCDISVPVYATVKGRASQIRSMPFTGDSSDDSSEGEDGGGNLLQQVGPNTLGILQHQVGTLGHHSSQAPSSHQSSDSSVSGSSPSKSAKTGQSLSPAKNKARVVSDTSFESGLSDDYAIPPDALSYDATTCDASMPSLLARTSYADSPRRTESLEKIGHLTKLGGKLKTWRKRWFVLKNGALVYWKSQHDVNRKPQGQIILDDSCRITRQDGASTFEINTGKKIYYLTADSIATMEEWVRILQNVQRRNAARLLLSKEDQKPTVQGWLTKVKNGHAKKCWCSLMGKMFLYFKTPNDASPLGQINMRDARVEEVEHISDSDSEEREDHGGTSQARLTVSIYPEHQGPTYLILPSKQERDNWLYHLTIVSGAGPNSGTLYEQLVQKLMETDGNPACEIWRHPQLLHSKDNIASPLTTLHSEGLQAEAIKLFKCCQLFASAAMEQAGIDYHVVLAQNALQQCLDAPELQAELICALVKQTSRHLSHNAAHSASSSATASLTKPARTPVIPSTPACCKSNPPAYSFVQCWQLLSLAVSLFTPRNSRLLWYLKLHLSRNSCETKTECGKYAAYCERALERTIQNGGRELKPSRMEVLSILLKNPYHHSLPHAIPVHMANGAYQVVGFDGSTTVEEFLRTLSQEIACRDSTANGFTLFSDDPIEKDLEHFIDPSSKLCDVISKWETALREKGSGKFENSRVIQLTYKNRLYWKHSARMETDKERLLMCYQVNHQVVAGRFPLSRELALEMASLMAQIDLGDRSRVSGNTCLPIDKFYPYRYRDSLSNEGLRDLQDLIGTKWSALKGRSAMDCVRIYLTCARKWPFFGASMFQARPKFGDRSTAWLAVSEDSVTVLELTSMAVVSKFAYSSVITFGGCQDDFMLVVGSEDGCGAEEKMLFAMSKPKVLEITLLIADYMNALGHTVPGTPQMNTLTRNGSRRSFRPLVVASTCNNTLSSHGQPDILKSTPDHQCMTTDSKRRIHADSSLA